MNSKVIIVRIKKELSKPISYLDKSYNEKSKQFYALSNIDCDGVDKLCEKDSSQKYLIMFLVYDNKLKDEKLAVENIFLGEGEFATDEKGKRINYSIYAKFDSKNIIKNLISTAEVKLKKDYEKESYIIIEDNLELAKQLNFIIKNIYNPLESKKNYSTYCEIDRYKIIDDFSQKNEHCIRAIRMRDLDLSSDNKQRSEYQRDYERIVHSKSFRRLVDKAQIFTSSKGDHYRTRMTHTLEVAQISRAIAIGLNLNVDLAEAIAMGHDLGHTPFGHQGERTIDDILKGNCNLNILENTCNNFYGGFKHNFQGLRVLDSIEDRYIEHQGLDLSYQVLEGILKHTKVRIKNCDVCDNKRDCDKKCFDIEEFLSYAESEHLYLKYTFPTTLEGQIVAIADEIAQRSHDIDDSFSSNIIDVQSLKSYLSLNKTQELMKKIEKESETLEEYKNKGRAYANEDEVFESRIASIIISYFIEDVITESLKIMEGLRNSEFTKNNELYIKEHRFDRTVICFSEEGKILNDYLDKIIATKVINNSEVVRFDEKAKLIVSKLFDAYYNNPKLLHEGSLMRMLIEIRKITNHVVDFINGDIEAIRKEFEMIKNPKESVDPELYWKKNKILVRVIADYISGMTDNYAINEYKKLFY